MSAIGAPMLDAFPFLAALSRAERDTFLTQVVARTLTPRQVLVPAGATCTHLPFVLSGALRVYKVSESGRELTLYRIERGESCVLTSTCILTGGTFPAVAESEGDTVVALAPAALMSRLVDEHRVWRSFVHGLVARRLDGMMTLVEEVAFHHVDERIAAHLLREAEGRDGSIRTTHERLAAELGTSREVVTRILHDFETQGLVSTLRGRIEVLDAVGLGRKARSFRAE